MKSLKLQVIRYKGLPPAEALVFNVGLSGGVIGRSPDSDFILPDLEKFVSRKHGVITFEQGEFYFTDTSTAGTYLGNRNVLLQHDTVSLSDGEVLKIGDYELAVQIVSTDEAFEAPGAEEAKRWPRIDFAEEPATAPKTPFFAGEWTPQAPTEPDHGHAFPSFVGQPDVAPQNASFAVPEPEPPTPSTNAVPEFDVEELLGELEPPPPVFEPSEDGWQIPDDLFGPDFAGFTQPEEESHPSLSEVPSVASMTAAGQPASVSSGTEKPGVVGRAGESMGQAESLGPMVEPPVRMPMPRKTPASPLPAEVQPPPVAPCPGAMRELFGFFLEGAGIGDFSVAREEQLPAIMKSLGVLFREWVDGMITVLRARAEEKRELRVTMTTMRAASNNPLKSTPSAEYALKIMLDASHPGFMEPVQAVREAFRDLMSHQMATTAGIQASLMEQLKRFDPKKFDQRFEEGIVFQKKAKCWDAYCKAYPELVKEVSENIFGDEFREAYEQQMIRLHSASGRNGP